MSKPVIRIIALACAYGVLTAAVASVVAFETVEAMARRVPVIVRGQVVRSVAGWDEQQRRIWTWTELVVTEPIKGRPGTSVLVKQPGGEVGGIGQAVAGAATFRMGEDCVLFLEPSPDETQSYRVSGLASGKVALIENQGVFRAVRQTEGIGLVKAGSVSVVPQQDLGTAQEFVARLHAVLGSAK
jgi:predicted outer membrane lipoprotein